MWHRLTPLSDLQDGAGREFMVGDRIIAVFRQGTDVWAIDGICPHAGGPLADGALQGRIVTCPWHGWQFDVSSGQSCLSSQIRQPCFTVQVVDGEVEVKLP